MALLRFISVAYRLHIRCTPVTRPLHIPRPSPLLPWGLRPHRSAAAEPLPDVDSLRKAVSQTNLLPPMIPILPDLGLCGGRGKRSCSAPFH